MTLRERLWRRVDASAGLFACWPWQGACDENGYGRILVDGRNQKASRVVWEVTHGPIPARLLICHTCDNPPCVNPTHLFMGTDSDNVRDCVQKGRHRTGSERLTAELVRIIRSADEPRRVLAARYGVSKTAIQEIKTGASWRHV